MTTHINWMPSDYMQRRPSKSEALFEGLKPLGQTASSYLNSKIEAMHEQQKEERQGQVRLKSAKGIAAAYKRPELVDTLSALEPAQQIAFAKDFATQSPQSNILSKLITGGKFEAPRPVEQASSSPAAIATNQAAAQRMGMGNPGQIPGMPQYAQQDQQGQLPFVAPQYQVAMGQNESAATPAGVVPPEPSRGQGNGLDLASFNGKRLGEMSREQIDALKDGQSKDIQKQLEDSYNKQKSAERGERSVSASERRATTGEKAFELKEKEFNEKTKDLSKEDKKFVEKIDNSMTTLYKAANSLQQMKKIREETEIGPGYLIFAKNREAASQYNATSKDTLGLINDLFPRGFTASEFKRVEETWAAHAGETNDTLKGKEEGLSNVLLNASKLVEKMNSFQNSDGSYPKGIQNKVAKELYQSDEFQDFITQVKNGPQLTSGQSDKPFKATQIPEGYGMRDTKTGKMYVSKDGKLVEVK